jgi:hypothetical protein
LVSAAFISKIFYRTCGHGANIATQTVYNISIANIATQTVYNISILEFTLFIPATTKLDTIQNHMKFLLHVSAFTGHIQESALRLNANTCGRTII